MTTFKLTTAAFSYSAEEAAKLKKLGFEFESTGHYSFSLDRLKISNKPTIDMNVITDMVDFIDEYGAVIVDGDSIKIYDDYVE